MFSIDDRAGNILTTVAVFLIAAAILYFARLAFLILLLSVFFAHLLEPIVAWIQDRSPLSRKSRSLAIFQVYLIGTIALTSLGYGFGPRVVGEAKSLSATVQNLLQGVSGAGVAASPASGHGLTAAQQLWIREQLVRHQELIVRVFERGASSVANVAAGSLWLLLIPILAIFVLRDGTRMSQALIESFRSRGNARAERILHDVDRLLAKYIRAQLALAALSFVFYSICMILLNFPDAIALALLGGALEFLPAVGWIFSAAVMLTVGFLTHSHWIWLAVLLIVWRLVQDYVNSPRIMGHSSALPPLIVVFALMVGAQVGGIAGTYLAVPAVAVLRLVWRELFPAPPSASPNSVSDEPMMQLKS